MANIKFYGSETSQTENHTLECLWNKNREIYINIEMGEDSSSFGYLCLDISTAIAFRKHLAQQIAKAKEVRNG